MHLLHQGLLGVTMLLLLGGLVVVKRVATGSILEMPKGSLLVVLVNVLNLAFLLVVNPLAAILLVTGRLPAVDPTHMAAGGAWIVWVLEPVGFALYVFGFLIMAWAL